MSFWLHARNTLFILLLSLLAVVLAVAVGCGVLYLHYAALVQTDGDWLMPVSIIATLAAFGILAAGGLFTPRLFTEITAEWMQGKLLLLLVFGAAPFCLGLLLFMQHPALGNQPEWFFALMNRFSDSHIVMGVYMMVFGGCWIGGVLYWSMHLLKVEAVLRYFLAVLCLLVVFLCGLYLFFAARKTLLNYALGIALGLGSFSLAIFIRYWVPDEVARSVEGRMRGLFWLMHLFELLLLVPGLWLLFDRDGFAKMLCMLPFELPDLCYLLLQDMAGFFLGIFLTYIGVLFMSASIAIQRERCPYCRRFLHRHEVDVTDEYYSYVDDSFKRTTKERTAEWLTDRMLHINHEETVEYVENVKYSGKKDVSCCYCRIYLGRENYSGSYERVLDRKEFSWGENKFF